jgi:DNA-binding NarL/FixJ family response regulator
MKILVIDDHPLIREALRHVLIKLDSDLALLEAEDCDAGLALAAGHPDVDLVLLDLSLPGTSDLSALELFRRRFPALPVVVVSARDEHDLVLAALDAGAMGFIPKTSSNALMINALRLVLCGGVYVPPQALPGDAESVPQPVALSPYAAVPAQDAEISATDLGLTDRQADVLDLMLQGMPNKLICRQLNLAEGTVKIHVTAILKALNVANRTQAVLAASHLGLRLRRSVGQSNKS